jgi:eukaryotic-like serine/threonine-protein kinase
MRVDIVTPAASDPISFAISPDGRRLAFVASSEGQPKLWVRPLDTVTAQPVAGTEGALYPFWSPDSRSIGFFAGGKLKRVDIGGGLPQTLADAGQARGGAWSPRGVMLFAASGGGALLRVPAAEGDAVAMTRLEPGHSAHRVPRFLPDGRQFLFYAAGSQEASGIYLGSLDSSEIKRLVSADCAGEYLPSGWLLFVRQGTLVARQFDASRGEVTGDPLTVASPVGSDTNLNVCGFSISASGLVVYRSVLATRRQLVWYDRSGKALGTAGAPDENDLSNPELSPDGRRIAIDRAVQGNTDVWILDGPRMSRFTFNTRSTVFQSGPVMETGSCFVLGVRKALMISTKSHRVAPERKNCSLNRRSRRFPTTGRRTAASFFMPALIPKQRRICGCSR